MALEKRRGAVGGASEAARGRGAWRMQFRTKRNIFKVTLDSNNKIIQITATYDILWYRFR